jgi:hypothetical protein
MSAYSDQALARSPDRYYILGEATGNGTMTDAAGNGNGVHTNSPVAGTGPISGVADTAKEYTAASSMLSVSNAEVASFSSATKASIICWMKKSGSTLLDCNVGTSANPLFACTWYTDNKIYIQVGNGSTICFNSTAAKTADSAFHHVAIVYDATLSGIDRTKVYWDGSVEVLSAGGTIPSTLGAADGTQKVEIGHSANGYSTGVVGHAQFYGGVALTSGQISSDYAAGTGGGGGAVPVIMNLMRQFRA